jgi:large repetitive protein
VPATTPLSVDESGTQTTFTVRLNSQPTQTVTIPVGSSNPLEGTVSPNSLTFDAQDWNSVKTVTITGVGDLRQDGNQEFQVVFGAITGGPNYAAITVPSLTVTNYDTDSAGILVEQTAPLVTREDGTQTSFRVRLARPPSANVTLPIFVIENDEARVVTAMPLTFTNMNSGAWVNVTIQGWDDFVADGEQPFRVQVGPAESTDVSYAGRTIPFLTGTNTDDDSPGVIVTPTTGLSVSEAGGPGSTATFDVRLSSQPLGTVTIPLQVLDPSQVTVNTPSLTFDASDWNGVKTVTVLAVNDAIADDTQPFNIALGPTQAGGMDPNYVGIVIPNVTGTATDNDTPGLETLPNVFGLPAPELTTDEGGVTDTFQVRLTSQPVAPVTITVTSTRPTEGTVSPASVVIQPADWNVLQAFTVTGIDDAVDDGAQQYAIQIAASSTDPNYNRTVPNLQARNSDNDTFGITLSAATLPPTSESGAPAQTFTLRLNSQPTADVIIDLASSDLGELAISTNRLTFTAANWNVAQSVTVTGVDEFIDDGNQIERVNIAPALSADPLYDGITVTTPAVTYVEIRNDDDDTAGIQLPDDSVTVYDQLSSDTFTVRLNSQPLGDVVIPLTVDDPSEVTLSANSLTFTPANWNTFQTVTVTGVEDGVRDFDASFQIHLGPATAASDLPYAGIVGNSVNVLAVDGGTSCRTIKAAGAALGDGMYVLDPDLQGPIARFNAWCDMTTARDGVTGGWTLVSWSRNTDTLGGVPYPGLVPCGSPNFNSCNRGSGVPTAALDGLFDISTELAQGQTITETAVMMLATPFVRLGQYEFAGSYVYGASLAGLSIGTGATTCSPLATGEYRTIAGPNTNEGVTVTLNQSLATGLAGADPATLLDYSAGNMAYRYSLGGRSATCAVNGTPPTSYLGTWQDTQYGPDQQNAAGAYSVWVR